MNRIIFTLLSATALTGFAHIAHADNINDFKAIDPTNTTDSRVAQDGDLNTASGKIKGSGNVFRIAQTGNSNTTVIRQFRDVPQVNDSKVIAITKGSGNRVTADFITSEFDTSSSDNVSNDKMNLAVTGDSNNLYAKVSGNNSALAQIVNGDKNDVYADFGGDNASLGVRIEGNHNQFVGNTTSTSSIQGFSNAKLNANIKGSGNRVENEQISVNEVVRETVIGDDNTVHNKLEGDSNKVSISALGDNNNLIIWKKSEDPYLVGYTVGLANDSKVTLSAEGHDNTIIVGLNSEPVAPAMLPGYFHFGINQYDSIKSTAMGAANNLKSDLSLTYGDSMTQAVAGSYNNLASVVNSSAISTTAVKVAGSANNITTAQENAYYGVLKVDVDSGNNYDVAPNTPLNIFDVSQVNVQDSLLSLKVRGASNSSNTQTNVLRQISGSSDKMTVSVNGQDNALTAVQQNTYNSYVNIKGDGTKNSINVAQGVATGSGTSNNGINVNIQGAENEVSAVQEGSYNTINAKVTRTDMSGIVPIILGGIKDTIDVVQKGDTNLSKAYIDDSGAGSSTITGKQYGDDNAMRVAILGGADTVKIEQYGAQNTANASIQDAVSSGVTPAAPGNNSISLMQTGSYNRAILAIAGTGNTLDAAQYGANNTMNVSFTGNDNTGSFTQTGHDLRYTLQSNLSGQNFVIDQHN